MAHNPGDVQGAPEHPMPRESADPLTATAGGSRPRVATFVLAGGKGARLGVLTDERPKPVLPVAGHRLVDFALSNAAHSGLNDVTILTQYRHEAIRDYVGDGTLWGFGTGGRRLRTLRPAGHGIYRGTADAVRQHLHGLNVLSADAILILAADHVYAMDYRPLIEGHLAAGADLTVAVTGLPAGDSASQYGHVRIDAEGRVRGFAEKPQQAPCSASESPISMGIYVARPAMLARLLLSAVDAMRVLDFGQHVFPLALERGLHVRAHRFAGYWRDAGTPASFLRANLDAIDDRFAGIGDAAWPVTGRRDGSGVPEFGRVAEVRHSLIFGPSRIFGTVIDSVILPGAHVEPGAVVKGSVLLRGAHVRRGAVIERCIVDRHAQIGRMGRVGAIRRSPEEVAVIGAHAVVPAASRIRGWVERGPARAGMGLTAF